MKKLFLMAVAGLFFAATSNAQVQRNMAQHKHMTTDSAHHFQRGKMMQELNLTTDQQTQMKALHQDLRQQRNAIQNDASLTADQKKEKMKELRQTQMEKMNSILTPDQQAKMKELRSHGRQNHEMRSKSNPMMQQLDLTADQKTQMKALHQNMQEQKNAIQNDTSLSAEQKKEKMKELHQSQKEKINAILTPEQQAKIKELRQQRKQDRQNSRKPSTTDQAQQS